MEKKFSMYEPFEPKNNGRFIVKLIGYDIPEWLVRNYRFYNDGENLMMELEVLEAVMFVINPTKLFDIESIKIEYLDPTGVCYLWHSFDIKEMNFKHVSDYQASELSVYNFVFKIDKASFKDGVPKTN